MEIHVVQQGETLYAIAGRYGVDPELLRLVNGVGPGGALAVGQTLVVQQVETFHVVQPGETLTTVARRYGITLRQLYRNNFFLRGDPYVQAGQALVIAYQGEKLGAAYTNGYAYPFIQRALLSATLPYMSQLTPFTYGIDAGGGLPPLDDGELLGEARRLGSTPLMHLSTLTESGTFSSQRAEMILVSENSQTALISQILETMSAKGYQGLDVDFEYIPGMLREEYAAFIYRLHTALAPRGLPVIVALAPKTRRDQPGLLYEGHDYARLGQAADYVLVMTYEWGYTYGPPMAVAPLPNVRQVLDYAVGEIPPQKIYLGIPNYGYDWTLPFVRGRSRARTISNLEAVQLAIDAGVDIFFDETAMSPYFQYEKDGQLHEVWFEDVRSYREKFSLLQAYGLRGMGYWQIMRLFRANWLLLADTFQIL